MLKIWKNRINAFIGKIYVVNLVCIMSLYFNQYPLLPSPCARFWSADFLEFEQQVLIEAHNSCQLIMHSAFIQGVLIQYWPIFP